MDSLNQTLASFIDAHPEIKRFQVALSGGLDSCVLLHLLAQQQLNAPVQVLHVNHQLSPQADAWQSHCEGLARQYGFPFIAERVNVVPSGGGVERAARDARYAAFEQHLCHGDMLLMAHHRDDQAETLLLRLLRGTGVRGLGAMASARSLGDGKIGRPLLHHSRADVRRYAQNHELQWVEDESNQSTDFDRNYLRLKVLPLLNERWPDFARRWAQTADLVRETETLLADYAAQELALADVRAERVGQSLSLAYLARLSESRRNALLRHWTSVCGYSVPEQVHLQMLGQFTTADADGQPLLGWGDCELRRFAQRLYLLPRLPAVAPLDQSWNPEDALALGDTSLLNAQPSHTGLVADREYRVTLRQGGERCQPHNRAHSQKLKKLLQEYRLEPWLRDRVPLIYAGDKLAAVGDLWVCQEFYTREGPAWRVEWSF